jgi:hypothetical protein
MASAIESEGLALIGAYDGCEQRRQRLRMFYWLGRMHPKPMRVRFGFGEVVGCAGGHARGRRLRRGVRRPTGATAGSAMNGCRRRLR